MSARVTPGVPGLLPGPSTKVAPEARRGRAPVRRRRDASPDGSGHRRAAREIVRASGTRGVDLVVMGSHKVEPGDRGWGTTSYKVGIACQCPILLVK
jgi:Universal stress protein family